MNRRSQKKIAAGLLCLMVTNILTPCLSYALTSGPTQPETTAFTPAGTSDMVDLFTGDFKYNIPLMDVDGYPLNLNYDSGSGMDDEASWTGLGWNVNVGAINRQLRGLPDDMSGDLVETEHYTKPKVTVGGSLSIKAEVIGLGKNLTGSGSFTLGVFSDNYTGIGATVGVNAGISFGSPNEGGMTAGLGTGLTSSTASGVDVSPYLSLGIKEKKDKNVSERASLSASLGFNSRSGMKSLTLGSSYGIAVTREKKAADGKRKGKEREGLSGSTSSSGSFISFNTEPILPNIDIPYKSRYGSFSIDAGPAAETFFVGFGGSGYKSVREVAQQQLFNPAYGFLYAERGKNQKNAAMDFIREKENPVIPDIPNLALPVHTPDLFSYTSQGGSGQFRLYRGGSGVFFDNEVSDDNKVTTIGGDIGYGATFHAGVTLFKQSTKSTSRKWVDNNNYLNKGDFQDVSYDNPNAQHAYFKVVGEKTAEDNDMVSKLHGTQPLEVSITGKTANAAFTNASLTSLKKNTRQKSSDVISYLTAEEAAKTGLDKDISNYSFNDSASFQLPVNHKPVPASHLPRVDNAYHQKHHISEITVTNPTGKRLIYGIPVYNTKQSEYSFAVGAKGKDYDIVAGTNNQVPLLVDGSGINHTKGIDNYYQKQTTPAYASSFLLTAILSPDYIDRTNDGISDDDPGTAIKFNYSKLPSLFKWRTPFHNATLNRGQLADPDDDKASIVYGEKEVWYANSIESKTKIAYFITQDRRDALGVTDYTGASTDLNNRQKCLKEIRLYSKADMSKPIKVVKFEYNYELCKGVPNSADNQSGLSADPNKGGKLTLKRIYFQYGNSTRGSKHPYDFSYSKAVNGQDIGYADMATDRWGVYKATGENNLPLKNDEYPYTNQDEPGSHSVKDRVDQNAALWHLNKIKLPTGGEINVNYESDDYAYVQNKRVMTMSGIQSFIDARGNDLDAASDSCLRVAKGFKVKISTAPGNTENQTQWFKKNYLNGADYIYSKVFTKMSTPYSYSTPETDYDFVPCYSKVTSVSVSGQYASIMLEDRSDGGVTANPIIFSAWQKIKNEYPRFAYPGFDKRAGSETAQSSVSKAVSAIFSAFGNLSELSQNFYQKSFKRNFAAQIQLNKSFVKLTKQDGFKLGGGVRVKKIRISDDWQEMSGNTKGFTASYGQAYDYTTVDTDSGITISSGVAAYEPSVGNDENPLKQPVPYVQKIKGAIDNFFELEEPFGESFFPAPTVGYSKVTVTDLDKYGNPDPALRTGYIENEFYTAKDFPVNVTVMPILPKHNKPINYLSFLGATSIDELCLSQGYAVELNDMHGKAKAVKTYNSARSEIASTIYYYNAEPRGASEMRLKNLVNIVNPDGTVSPNQVIGRDIEFFTDFRENESRNPGHSYNLGFDMVGLSWFSFPLPHFPNGDNSEYKLFRSACAVKISTCYGIIDKVVQTENGSSITTQNLAYDGVTGKALVTKTQNEFNKNIYSLNLPAYWAYKGMGAAYQNQGIVLKNFSTNANGEPAGYSGFLQAGDEIADLTTGTRYWVIDNRADQATGTSKKLINRKGQLISYFNAAGLVKLVRSGFRNLLDEETAAIVSLNNPIQGGKLRITANEDMTGLGVINASAATFNQSWPIERSNNPSDSTRVENTSAVFTFTASAGNANHGHDGAMLLDTPGTRIVQNAFLKGGLDRSGIWLNPPNTQYLNVSQGFETTFSVASEGLYTLGYSGDDDFHYSIDNVPLPNPAQSPLYWTVLPLHLTAGKHYLTAECTNLPLQTGQPDNPSSNPGGIGLELYHNTLSQLENAPADGSGIQVLFTTRNLVNNPDLQSFRTVNGVKTYRFTYRRFTNPYIGGYLGNWRAYQSKVFQQSRYSSSLPEKGVDVKSGGYIQNFASYWFYGDITKGETPGWQSNQAGNRARWVTANTVTSYDKFGQQLENKDALNRYSAAKFIFNGELPAAVASNAMNREIYTGSFEDSFFTPGTVPDSTKSFEFVQAGTMASIKPLIVADTAHSGNYSVLLPAAGIQLNTRIHERKLGIDSLLTINEYGEYNTRNDVGIYPNGFEPNPAKKYIFNAWVRDTHPADKSVNLTLSVNGTNVPLICKALVEDWKLVEGAITTSALGTDNSFHVLISPVDPAVYIDDIRMHPFDSHMKTYVYDDKTMRLMAELDENGFATFYEYDDEGLLIRVKKETERGIMTIKETRSSYKKSGS
ncbi:hypothetical protein ACFGVS_01030 [Mucilaginibacter sp. AW1-7]|uniref:hypothetical protein n=1 Tax=Mucilaginibacter sp. AW1-7 TaxID=3349874 RepID=UPI003F741A87